MKKSYVEMFKVITVGLLFGSTALQAGVVRQSFHYDEAGRLIEVRSEGKPELAEAYRYDASGNIIEKRQGSEVIDMSYDQANQLKSRSDANGTVEFVYDSAGRLVEERLGSKVLASYEYGYLDKVTSVTRGNQLTRFHYNARGMLVGKERNGKMIETMGWDGIGLLAKGDTVYANEAHISGGVPLMSIDQGESAFYDHDYLGTTTASYNQQGDTDVKLTGSLGSATTQSDVRFTGKTYDKDLGAHVFPFRNYRSDVGRWASADPAGFPDGPNQHFYSPVPTHEIDPWGLASTTANYTKTVTDTPFIGVGPALSLTVDFEMKFTVSSDNKTGEMPSIGTQPTFEHHGGNLIDNTPDGAFGTRMYRLQSLTGTWGEVTEVSRKFTTFDEPLSNGAVGKLVVEFEVSVYADMVRNEGGIHPDYQTTRLLIRDSTFEVIAYEF